jgi:hypothetical protein
LAFSSNMVTLEDKEIEKKGIKISRKENGSSTQMA